MTEKQKHALSKVMDALPDDCRGVFREIAEYAISLGYMPALKGARGTYLDFMKSKVKRMILKIDTDPKFPPRLAIKFFAIPAYTGIFLESIVKRLDVLAQYGVPTGCYGCGRCDRTWGYTYALPDGRQGFLCGGAVIDLPSLGAEHVSEVKNALKMQDDFFVSRM